MSKRQTTGSSIPDDVIASRVAALVAERGTTTAAKALGISREATCRIVARIEVRAGTLALAQQRLASLDAADAPRAA